jgi:RNA recognition motif-containing protein
MSLSSFFEKRGKKQTPSQSLTTLLSEQQSGKFKELKEDPQPSAVVHLPP